MKAVCKYYLLLLLFCASRFSVFAQWPDKSHLPPDTLMKIVCIDSNERILVTGGIIDLKLKDRIFPELPVTTVELTLEVRNTSAKTLIVPDAIDCYDDSGFNSDYLDVNRGVVLLRGKTKKIPLRLNCSRREVFHRTGYVTVYVDGTGYVRYPIQFTVHFTGQDGAKTIRQ